MSKVHSGQEAVIPTEGHGRDVVSGLTPWIVEDTGSRLWVGPSKAWAHKVGDVVCAFDIGSDLTEEANERARIRASLIAAAPEMLEALDGILHFTDGFGFYRTQSPAGKALEGWIEAARAIIDKATTANSVGTEAPLGRSAPSIPPVKTGEG
jgi:hypothetical protein